MLKARGPGLTNNRVVPVYSYNINILVIIKRILELFLSITL
ncbi:MAG: hypothetical protein [Olavius algarvensis Gamma 1 endosymbiont]|nr:MAG: hypothetical protein [Olavius algarvensis Gamma 1 endosymbiont]